MSTPAAAERAPCLRAALHIRIEPPFAPQLPTWIQRATLAGDLAGRQLAAAIAATRAPAPEGAFVSTTLLDRNFVFSAEAVGCFQRAFEAAAGQPLLGIVNAYLCAGWGYALRHAMRHTTLQRVAMCIVDLDLNDLQSRAEHPLIGRSGFGLSTMVFDLPAARLSLPVCGGPHANSAYPQLVMAIRAHRARQGDTLTFMPFTRPALRDIAERALGTGTLATNRHDTWGHCFGSDPWIGLIEWLQGRAAVGASALHEKAQRIVAGAVGFNGYFTFAAIDVPAHVATSFQVLQGSDLTARDLRFDVAAPPLDAPTPSPATSRILS